MQARPLSGLAGVLALLTSAVAGAQNVGTASPQTQSPDENKSSFAADVLQEVVVTAQFRDQSLQQTPIAITAITAATLEARGNVTLVDVANAAPNVTVKPGGSGQGASARIFIRGVGQSDFNFAFEPGVGVYVDDVYYSTVFGSMFELQDLDRVEILRGPQGTLAGKNSEGGAVKLYSKKPDGQGGGYVEATYGNYRHVQLRGGADFTVIPEHLFFRISGVSNNENGYVTRLDYACSHPGSTLPTYTTSTTCVLGTEGGIDYTAGRAALRWVASDGLEVNLIGDYTKDNSQSAATTLRFANNATATLNGVPYDSRFIPTDPYTNYSNYTTLNGTSYPAVSTVSGGGVSGTVDWTLTDNYSIKSITAYRNDTGDFSQDGDGSPINVTATVNHVATDQFTQELRLNGSTFGKALDYTIGGFYVDAHQRLGGLIASNRAGGLTFLGNDPIASSSRAEFIHAIYHATDKLNFAGGLRHTQEEKSYSFFRSNPDGSFNPIVGPLTGVEGNYSGSNWDYRAEADYQWTPELMTYANYSTAFKGGGVNPRPFFPSQALPFGPEKLVAYELGLKSQFFEDRMRLNLSVFSNDYRDIQLILLQYQGRVANLPANVGAGRMKGAELEIEAHPVRGMTGDFSASYLDFTYSSLDPITGIRPNMTLPFVQKWKLSLGLQQRFLMGAMGSITPRIDASYESAFFINAVNAPSNRIPSNVLVNGRLTWSSANGEWDASISGQNLLNKQYLYSIFDQSTVFGVAQGTIARPRTYAVTLKRSF